MVLRRPRGSVARSRPRNGSHDRVGNRDRCHPRLECRARRLGCLGVSRHAARVDSGAAPARRIEHPFPKPSDVLECGAIPPLRTPSPPGTGASVPPATRLSAATRRRLALGHAGGNHLTPRWQGGLPAGTSPRLGPGLGRLPKKTLKLLGATVCFGDSSRPDRNRFCRRNGGAARGQHHRLVCHQPTGTAGLYLVFLQSLRGEPVNIKAGSADSGPPRYWQPTPLSGHPERGHAGFAIPHGRRDGTDDLSRGRKHCRTGESAAVRRHRPFAVGALVAIVAVICFVLLSGFLDVRRAPDSRQGTRRLARHETVPQVVNRHPLRFSIIPW